MSPRPPRDPDLLSQIQVCRRLGISDETWRRWRKARRTPEAIPMPSGRLRWRRADIDRLTGTSTAGVGTGRFFQAAYRRA